MKEPLNTELGVERQKVEFQFEISVTEDASLAATNSFDIFCMLRIYALGANAFTSTAHQATIGEAI